MPGGRLRTRWERCAWLALSAGLLGCPDPSPPCQQLGALQTNTDSCVAGEACADGLECLPQPGVTASCAPPAPYCAAPRPEDDALTRQLLVRGFATSGVQLRRLDNMSSAFARFEWDPPLNASIAVCALFGCAPLFENGSLINAERCLWREQRLRPVPRTLDVRDVRATGGSHAPAVALRFGCWLFSDVELVGATQLERLTLSEVPDLRDFARECEGPIQSQGSCVLASESTFLGLCQDGVCTRRCVRDEDCLDDHTLIELDAGLPDAGALAHLPHCARDRATDAAGTCHFPQPQGAK